MNRKPVQAVLLDRDGVINADSPDYILSPGQWQPIPGSLAAISRLHQAGIVVAIVSNQSALGRGMLNEKTFRAIHAKMLLCIEEAGGAIAHVAYCPHAPDEGCACRKPLPRLVHESLEALQMQAEQARMIGDSLRDVQAALSAGVMPILVQSGYGDAVKIARQAQQLDASIAIHADLNAAVNQLLEFNASC